MRFFLAPGSAIVAPTAGTTPLLATRTILPSPSISTRTTFRPAACAPRTTLARMESRADWKEIWLFKPRGVDCREAQFSGDEEEDRFHGLEAGLTARFSFGGLGS
jgi:hypothetical protein